MASENSRLGQLIKGYLFVVDKTETDLSVEIGLSRSRLSAAMHGKYRLKRDHVDRLVTALAKWGVRLTEEDYTAVLNAWEESRRPTVGGAGESRELDDVWEAYRRAWDHILDPNIPPPQRTAYRLALIDLIGPNRSKLRREAYQRAWISPFDPDRSNRQREAYKRALLDVLNPNRSEDELEEYHRAWEQLLGVDMNKLVREIVRQESGQPL